MPDISSFRRYEYKYLMDEEKYALVRELIRDRLTLDSYGLTTICNIYYDTDDFRLVRNSIESPLYKEKLRLRSYGIPGDDSKCFIEIKKKFDGVVYKRRISVKYRSALDYLRYGVRPVLCEKNTQILHEIDYFREYYKPVPKVYIAYEREAFYGNDDSAFRVTFDTDIRSRTDMLDLSAGSSGKCIFPEKMYLMEAKAAGAMPLWFVKILNEAQLRKTTFSKYGTVYRNGLWRSAPIFEKKTADDPEQGTVGRYIIMNNALKG